MIRLPGFAVTLLLALGLVTAASPEVIWPNEVDLPAGEPIDESYRHEFAMCDAAGTFQGSKSRYTHGCPDDPNAVTALRRLPGGVIAYVSKLAIDLDGSPLACGPNRASSDQCPTSLTLSDDHGRDVPVNADVVPYVVIPDAGPGDTAGPAKHAGDFQRLTDLRIGDFGVVIARGRTVPVIVGDTGPYSKLGEGSLALHRLLGHDQCASRDAAGTCTALVDEPESIGGDVTTILFPGSARQDLTPANISAITREEGLRRWNAYKTLHRMTTGEIHHDPH